MFKCIVTGMADLWSIALGSQSLPGTQNSSLVTTDLPLGKSSTCLFRWEVTSTYWHVRGDCPSLRLAMKHLVSFPRCSTLEPHLSSPRSGNFQINMPPNL